MSKARRALCVASLLLLAGCRIGPRYHEPKGPTPNASTYKETHEATHEATDAHGTWKVASPSDAMLRGKWWQVFREPELDGLEDRLNFDNNNIKQAFELYIAARAQIRQAEAGYWPTVTAAPGVTMSHTSGTFGVGSVTAGSNGGNGFRVTQFTAPAQASWAPDLFGRVQNTVKQFQYGAQISAADLESQRLVEQATLAQTFFQIRGQDTLQEVLDATVDTNEKVLRLNQSLYETGIGTEVAVVQAEQTLEASRVAAINVRIARAQLEHAIATLLGVPAADFSIPKRSLLGKPPPIPMGMPSQLLERRPDIAAAERAMAQANAIIGIGYSAFFPALTLTGSAGFSSSDLTKLFTWPSFVWSIGASISQPLFDAGLRRATVDQYIAQYNATVAGYRQTVLTAFQQVEDFLATTAILSEEVDKQKEVVNLAERAFDLERSRYETGIDPYLNLMTQQQILLSSRQTLVNLQIQQMVSAVNLVQALGGGWDRSELPSTSEVSKRPEEH
ncbi:efflux transporter outer membrane subunit [Labilithrix luteola]|nr:efflux transporter outer membrane subunit [Labilithrix luteola]